MKRAGPIAVGLLVACAAACGDAMTAGGEAGDAGPDAPAGPPVPWPIEPFPLSTLPTGDLALEARVELGRLLFHDPILSSDGTVACLTCHSPIWGMSDGLPRSIGIGGVGPIGTGRTGPNATARNSQALWNVAFRRTLFWDGRAGSLEEQVRGPLADPIELGRSLEAVTADLAAIPAYVELFQAAFPGAEPAVRAEHIPSALADFQRTLVSDRAPYDQYVGGDAAALTASEVAGLFAFAELGCDGCHTPPLFEVDRFEPSPLAATSPDIGREAVTGDPSDRGHFRVPSLRNARETGPWFHDGSTGTLDEAIALEVAFRTGEVVDAAALQSLVDFIAHGLMDKGQAPSRPEAVPSGLPVPLDGYRVPR